MLLLAALALLRPQDPPFQSRFLPNEGRVDRLVARDLDGDGYPDLLVQNGHDLRVFLYEPSRGFPEAPRQELRLDGTVFLWTLAAPGPGKTPALLTAGSRALRIHLFDRDGFSPRGTDLAVHPSLFTGLSSGPPLFSDFAPDLDGDGFPELLLFRKNELFLLKGSPSSEYRCLQKLPLPLDETLLLNWGAHLKMTETGAVPPLFFGDVDGDGRADISYYQDESITVFRQNPDGTFSTADAMDLLAEKPKRRDRFVKFDVPPRVADLNGDGLLDIVAVYPTRGRVQVHYGSPGRRDYTQPDEVRQVADGWSTGVYLEDLSGRGRLDLVMGVVRRFGITGGIQAFLSGKIDLELHVYLMQADGRYSQDPVQELKFSIPYVLQVSRTSANFDLAFRPSFKGDFNGDGLRDMLVAPDGNTLRIHYGSRDRGISEQPSRSILMNPPPETTFTEPFVADFNRDGISDLILKHAHGDPVRHTLELQLSRGR